ncbi:MAG: PilT protein domain protein [Actinomycetospora sp.]|jgi:PIN domain nuclease of toxin-antitoxin system|nr:PilT protein domain protein [Actinomycetospora sp.]
MRLLLDTHAVLWSLGRPGRVGSTARTALTARASEVVVSVVSLWEIAIKVSVGKLRVDLDVEDTVTGLGIGVLDVRAEHAREVRELPLHHRDPFDRMLVAQARHEGLTLVTADRRLEAYSVAVLRADA